LRLTEDDRGLAVEADLDPTDPETRAVVNKLRGGDLDGQMSFAFQATEQDWNDAHDRRLLKAISLHRGDVSLVNMGASP
jgi:HK97 family phage prohead protease